MGGLLFYREREAGPGVPDPADKAVSA